MWILFFTIMLRASAIHKLPLINFLKNFWFLTLLFLVSTLIKFTFVCVVVFLTLKTIVKQCLRHLPMTSLPLSYTGANYCSFQSDAAPQSVTLSTCCKVYIFVSLPTGCLPHICAPIYGCRWLQPCECSFPFLCACLTFTRAEVALFLQLMK